MEYLLDLYGIGPVTAKRLLSVVRKKTGKKIADITRSDVRNTLSKMDDIPDVTKLDIKYDILKRIPRAVIAEIEAELPDAYHVLGSYYRGANFSSDVDVLVVLEKGKKVPPAETYIPGAIVAASGDAKETIIAPVTVDGETRYIKIDVYNCTQKQFHTFCTYLIGSRKWNIVMRGAAKRKGYMLNQYGLFRDGKRVPVKSEADIFEKIGLTYREPKNRNI
jgi:DNA polymerase/3'-5' exonuclease PolX